MSSASRTSSQRHVPITGSVLGWALAEEGLTAQELATRIKVPPRKVSEWIDEKAQPTRGEFGRVVQTLRRPRAMFLLPSPPKRSSVPAQLRNASGLINHDLSRDELRAIRTARRLQDAAADLLRATQEDKVVTLPRADRKSSAQRAARLLREFVGVPLSRQLKWANTASALRGWREALEEKGILVFQLPLGGHGVRGFSISNQLAPLVALNTAYNEAARIYTLFHELAHLASRTDSACSTFIAPSRSDRPIERWCEEVAAWFLMPPEEFEKDIWERFDLTKGFKVRDFKTAASIAKRYKVSIRACAMRLIRVDLALPSLYGTVDAHAQVVDRPKDGGGGGRRAAEVRVSQVGPRVTRLLLRAVDSGQLPVRDAADFLRLTTSELDDLHKIAR